MTKYWIAMNSPKGKPIPTREELLEKFRAIEEPRDRALVCFLFLTAARIREALIITRKQIRREGKYYVIRLPTEKKHVILKKITLSDGHKKFKVARRLEVRDVPINIERDRDFIALMSPWIKSRSPNGSLWGFKTRQRAWQILGKYGLFPHLLRHARITYLVTVRGFTDQELVQFIGWANSEPAKYYVHMRWQDIAKRV